MMKLLTIISTLLQILLIQTNLIPKKFPKIQKGDFVSVTEKRNLYSKGYTTNWNIELFEIHKITKTNPVTYTLEDENNELIEGKYYQQELLRKVFNFESNPKVLESMIIFNQFEE